MNDKPKPKPKAALDPYNQPKPEMTPEGPSLRDLDRPTIPTKAPEPTEPTPPPQPDGGGSSSRPPIYDDHLADALGQEYGPKINTAQPPEPGLLSRDEFRAGFEEAFEILGDATGLQTLPIRGREVVPARHTADRLYALALKYPWLRFMIESGGWIKDWGPVLYFAYLKSGAIRAELGQRAAASRNARSTTAEADGAAGSAADPFAAFPTAEEERRQAA